MVVTFIPTDEELKIVARIYEHAGCKRLGKISGDAVVDIFSESVDLSPLVLSNIWNMADEDKSGDLSERGLAIAIRLIGWVQKGEEVRVQLLNNAGPLPTFKGPLQPQIEYNEPKCPRPEWPPFTKHSRDVFNKLFHDTGPDEDLLAGDKVRDVFLQSNLPPEDLWKIWNLADTQHRGALDANDFALGMYLIQIMLSGSLKVLPPTIPTHIYRSIFVQKPPPPQQTTKPLLRTRSYSGSTSKILKDKVPQLAVVPEKNILHSPPAENLPSSTITSSSRPIGRLKSYSSGNTLRDTNQWVISAAERAQSNRDFDSLDHWQQGFLEGDNLAKYMLTFKLPPEDLALIWDLADLNHDNRLTRDSFAIAMHLIHKRRSGLPVPSSLPPSLLPPPNLRAEKPLPPAGPQTPKCPSPPQAPTSAKPALSIRSPSALPSAAISPVLATQQLQNPPPPRIPISPKPPISRRTSSASSPSVSPTKERRPPPLPPKPISPMVNVQRRRSVSSVPSSAFRQSAFYETEPETPTSPPTSIPSQQYEELERENARLKLRIDDLTAQLSSEADLKLRNTALTEEVELLITKTREMEQTSGHLLWMNEEQRRTLEELTDEVQRLNLQLTEAGGTRENLTIANRRLEVSMQEKSELGARLYEARESAEKAVARSREEIENLERRIARLEEEKKEVQDRATMLERSISGATDGQAGSGSTTNLQEMQILMGDITGENEQLKMKLRTLQQSTAQMFLSNSNGQGEIDELRRANSALKAQLGETQMLMRQLQQSSEENELLRVMKDVTLENDTLKARMREMREELVESEGRQAIARESLNTQVEGLRREVEDLMEEARELRLRLQSRATRSTGHEQDAMAPPAYEELAVGGFT